MSKSKARKLVEFLRNVNDDAKLSTSAVEQDKIITSRVDLEAGVSDTESLVTPAAVTSYVGNKLGEYVHGTHDIDLTFTGDVTGSGTITDMGDTSFSLSLNAETLPDQTGHSGQFLTTNGTVADWATVDTSNGDTAYSWGDHADAGYLTSYDETDPVFTASAAHNITTGNIANWEAAYSWGDHSAEGYLTSETNDYLDSATFSGGTLTLGRTGSLSDVTVNLDGRYSQTDTNTTYSVSAADVASGKAIRLTGSNSVTDDVILAGGSNVSLTRSGDTITINSADAAAETITTLTKVGNDLKYVNEAGTTATIDLTSYLDDTNLSKILSGTMSSSGIATFSRDDNSTFTVDMSVLLDDTNLARIVSAAWNTGNGVLTLTRNDGSTIPVDLDNRYLQSYTETDTLQSVTTRGNSTSRNITISKSNTGAGYSSYADMMIEDTDAHLDITSTNGGTWGSAINLREGNTTSFVNSWTIARTTGASPDLRFNFGTGNDHNIAGTKVRFTSSGQVHASSFHGSIDYSNITNPPVIDNNVDYINGASFNTGNGVLTLSGVGRAGATVDLDSRYELAHSHPYLSNATDSEQTAHFGTVFWNQGDSKVNSDPRINEGNYDADLTNIHWWATTATGGNYGRVGHALYNGSAYQYLHTKASQNALYHNNNVIWTAGNFNPSDYLLSSNYVDNYADSVSFNTSNGILTIGRTGSLADLTVDLDGRYLTSETDSQTLSWNGGTGQLSISNGNTVDLDNRYLTAGSSYDLTGDIRVTSGSLSFYGDTHMGFIPYPNGGQFRSDSGSLTGYIKISLPDGVDNSDDMISFWVDIFDYTTSESVSLFIGGYNYQSTGNYWVNCTAQVFTKSASKDYTVRFGFDGSRKFVTIGETTSTWSHPSVVVRDFQTSFRGNVTQYRDDWAITTSTSAFSGVDETQIGNLPQSSSAKKWTTARTITLSGDLNGSVSIDGSANVTLSAQVVNDSHSHSNYVDLTSDQVITGAKTFTSGGNRYNGHLYYDAYDANGNHYPHFLDGSGSNGVTVNWRIYNGSSLRLNEWDYTYNRFHTNVQAPIFYDSNDTNYFVDPASGSESAVFRGSIRMEQGNTCAKGIELNSVKDSTWPFEFTTNDVGNDNSSGFWVGSNGYPDMRLRRDDGTVRALISSWEESFVSNGFRAEGTSQLNGALYVGSGTSSNIYMRDSDHGNRRIHCNSNRIGFLTSSNGWGSYCVDGGDWYSDQSVRSPIFYDSNDTSYYGDFASNSSINQLRTVGHISVGSHGDSSASTVATTAFITFGSLTTDAVNNYSIGTRKENYGGNYNKLDLAFHTGIRLGAHPNYGGVRFFSDQTMGTEIASIGKSGNYLLANNSARAPIFYDSNNTGWYLDPSATSNINSLIATGDIYGRSSNAQYSNLYRFGGIYFTWDSDSYGTNTHHSIRSTDGDDYGDHITLNSFGNVRINFDSNSNGTNYFYIGSGSTGKGNVRYTLDEGGNGTTAGSVRAPIFYDSANTGYYWNPGTSAAHRLQTPSGYLDIGPMNATYCHFQTDRGEFYFNKTVRFDGSGARSYDAYAAANFPIYYDYANTAYYTDSASESVMAKIKVKENTSTPGYTYMTFKSSTDTQYGSIYRSYGTMVYGTSSDYRLKENVISLSNASDRLNQLQPKRFNFIEYSDVTVDGFIAHEVAEVVPEAVVGEKDAVDHHGKPIHQSVDHSKLVPLLTASLQEALAKIEDLETRLSLLEQ
jgi:hypothetical protein